MKERLYVEDKILGTDNYIKLEYPNTTRVEGVGPCIGFAIYDPVKKFAYAGHLEAGDIRGFEKAVKTAVKQSSSVDNLKVTLVGSNSPSKEFHLALYKDDDTSYEGYVQLMEQYQKQIMEILLKHNIPRRKIRNKLGNASIDGIVVDTRKGTMRFQKCNPKEEEKPILDRTYGFGN